MVRNQENRWYDPAIADGVVLPAAIKSVIQSIESDQDYRRRANRVHALLYGDGVYPGVLGHGYSGMRLGGRQLNWNVTQSCVDATVAHIGTDRPKVKALPVGALWAEHKKAENLTYFFQGAFRYAGVYPEAARVFKDAAIFGTGFLKCYVDRHGDIMTARVNPDDIVVDDRDAQYGAPRSLFEHKFIQLEVLLDEYPDQAEAIRASVSSPMRFQDEDYYSATVRTPVDRVSVVEAWHLPSGPDADDGRHSIVVSNVTLLDETEWSGTRFPFAVFRWSQRPMGYYGQGIPEALLPIQYSLRKTLRKMEHLIDLATTHVAVQVGWGSGDSDKKQVNTGAITNEDMSIIPYGDRPPVFTTVKAFDEQYLIYVDHLLNRAYELVGISQLAAQSKKPEGLSSGTAFREYKDIQSARFKAVGIAWEEMFVDLADMMIERAREIDAAGDGDYRILVEANNKALEISWKDVNPEKDRYVIQTWPVPLLTGSPAYQLQTVIELGEKDPELSRSMLRQMETPDVKAVVSRVTAQDTYVEQAVQGMLEGKKYAAPNPWLSDLAGAKAQVSSAMFEAINAGESEVVIHRFEVWLEQAEKLQQEKIQQMQAQMAPPPGPPGMPPGMPPGPAGPVGPGGPPGPGPGGPQLPLAP